MNKKTLVSVIIPLVLFLAIELVLVYYQFRWYRNFLGGEVSLAWIVVPFFQVSYFLFRFPYSLWYIQFSLFCYLCIVGLYNLPNFIRQLRKYRHKKRLAEIQEALADLGKETRVARALS